MAFFHFLVNGAHLFCLLATQYLLVSRGFKSNFLYGSLQFLAFSLISY